MARGLEAMHEIGRGARAAALSLEDVSMTFGTSESGHAVRALQNINLEIRAGAFVSLIGPSGCGKSTLLRLLGDLLAPTQGTIRVNGRSPREARLAREYGMVFQQPVLYDWRTVTQNVQLPLEVMRVPAAERRQRAATLLDLVGLTEFAERYPWELSGGMQQKFTSRMWWRTSEFEFLALMDKLKYDPDKDLNVIKQGFTMDPFLAGQMEAASAMTYNEYQIVLESGLNPEDLNVIRYNDQGVGMLEDNLFATEDMVNTKPDVVQRFVRASLKGWQSAIDDQAGAVDIVMKYAEPGSTTAAHQTRMMSEVAKLVLPPGVTPDQIGVMDADRFKTTADIALKYNVISAPADPAKSYTNDFVGTR